MWEVKEPRSGATDRGYYAGRKFILGAFGCPLALRANIRRRTILRNLAWVPAFAGMTLT